MHFLIAEDDTYIAALIALHINELPARTTIAAQGWQALDEAGSGKYDFLILDLMLPGINGMEICRKLRQQQVNIPILMLTAKSEEQDKIAGLEQGADDYLTKPFSPGELLARVKSVLRRTQRDKVLAEKRLERIERGELCLDIIQKTLRKGGKNIELTQKEFELLQLFMQNPGRNYSRQEILDQVWGEQFDGLEHTVNSNINRLRAKIEEDQANPHYILTSWGIGYKFNSAT